MLNPDELLQQKLDALERGESLDAVLAGLEEDPEDLQGLISLAAAVSILPHPEPLKGLSKMKEHQIAAAAGALAARVNGKIAGHQPALPTSRPARVRREKQTWQWTQSPVFFGGVLGAAFLVLVGVVTLFGLGLWLVGPLGAQTATLAEVTGTVQVSRQGAQDAWQIVPAGERLHSGARIQTLANSQATLVFFEGSRTTIGPNSDLTLTRVDGGWGKALRVVLTQNAGDTIHQVVPLRGSTSSFMVFTPSGAASVHGTIFSVEVDPQGRSRFSVSSGKVLVSNDASQLFLAPGQATALDSLQVYVSPDYQFSLQGPLSTRQGHIWTVSGVSFTVNEDTVVEGSLQINSIIKAEGRVLAGGEWVADNIQTSGEDRRQGSFSGPLEEKGAQAWQVGDRTLLVNDQTVLGKDLNLGNTVRVLFMVTEAGDWQALHIESLAGPSEGPTPTPTATPIPGAFPSLEFTPDELDLPVCEGTDWHLTGTLANNAGSPKDVAANVELGYQVVEGAEFVDALQLHPALWAQIAASEQETFDIQIRLNQPLWQAAPAGTEVKARVFIANETNWPDNHPARLTVTLEKSCDKTPEATPTPTQTQVVTQTVTATPAPVITTTITVTPTLFVNCTGANPHPEGMRLAQRWGVPYDEIMGWFCQKFGFGEIDLAYGLSRQSGVQVADIFAMRRAGLGWGEIKKRLEYLPSATPTPTITATLTPTATVPVTGTSTPSPTPTPTPTSQPSSTPGMTTCTGANPHPEGLRLAQRWGVPYEEIMGWFCQGFGFGEIDQAYELSRQSGMPIANVFEMRMSGMGWGAIKKQLSSPPTQSAPKNNGKDKDKKKNK